jgi:hypothetical protein
MWWRGKPAMTDYRFEIGERVTYSEKRFPSGVWTAELVVVEQLAGDGTPEYRLRHHDGATEHVLAEHELSPSLENKHFEPSPWAACYVHAKGHMPVPRFSYPA